MLIKKEQIMENLSTTYPQPFPAMVYIGKSKWDNETQVATCGWCKTENFKGATIRKIMQPTFRIMVQSIKEAKTLEKMVHDVLDAKFGHRAFVWGCCSDMNGNKPNRSDEWWYCSASDIEAVLTELTIKGEYREKS